MKIIWFFVFSKQIHKTFEKLYDLWVPRTTIVTWVNSIQNELNQFMIETPVPSSRYWGYDEIFLRISKEKWVRVSFNVFSTSSFVSEICGLTKERQLCDA